MDVDELYAVRNNFYVGNFQVAIDEGESTPPLSQQKQIELDVYVARSRLALGQGKELITSINQAPMAMEAVKTLAMFEAVVFAPLLTTLLLQQESGRISLETWFPFQSELADKLEPATASTF